VTVATVGPVATGAATADRTSLRPAHALLAVAVMAVWGSNFVVIKFALAHLPPLLLGALRFAAVFFPACLFVKRPAVSWGNLAAYGVLIGAGQFGAVFIALRHDITPGLASLIVQTQVFFTIGLAMMLTGERLRGFQAGALLCAVAGIAIIVAHTDGTATPLGIAMMIFAGFCWASGNMVSRAAGKVDMLGYIVWSGVFAVPPLVILALIFEGWPAMLAGIRGADAFTWGAVVWQAVGNAMFGYGVWGWLLARYPTASVAPMSLMVPVFGMGTSALVLSEPLPGWKLAAAALVMSGLGIGLLWPYIAARYRNGKPV
jgi:O-acetylserine/cysteine efflux transporter